MKKCPSFAGIQKVLPELYKDAARKQDLFEGFDCKFCTASFDASFSVLFSFSNKSCSFFANIESRGRLSSSFPAFVHVLMIAAFWAHAAALQAIHTVGLVAFVFIQADTVVVAVRHGEVTFGRDSDAHRSRKTFISNDEGTSKAEAAVALEKQNLTELRFRDYHISIIVHSDSIHVAKLAIHSNSWADLMNHSSRLGVEDFDTSISIVNNVDFVRQLVVGEIPRHLNPTQNFSFASCFATVPIHLVNFRNS